jgi:outer membrane protein OmpA-like peptidoglycan-associated protein
MLQTQYQMEENNMRKTSLLAGAGLLLGAMVNTAAWAQSNPTAQQIIDSLKPSGTLSDTTRGIKPLPPGDGGTMAPMGAMNAPNKPPAPAAAPSTNLNIEFATGSAALTPQATSELDQLGKALTSAQLAAFNFKIVGHTDTVGDPATNQSLSDARAQAVKSYLEAKYSIADTRLQATGVGETDLLVATPPQTPEPRNRLVQVINIGQ